MTPGRRTIIKEDFLAWSGGFPPDSEDQIFLYVEFASPQSIDQRDARAFLLDWMDNCNRELRLASWDLSAP
jgi:hypothetical protein